MNILGWFLQGIKTFENYIPYVNLADSWEEQTLYYFISAGVYFTGRLALTYLKPYLKLEKDESVSRIMASISQIGIVVLLFQRGALWGIQAFVSYCINDMLYSIVYKQWLQPMIYVHHTVGIFISSIGLYAIQAFPQTNDHYMNCRKCTIFLLCMEMSAPLLSFYWILKHEKSLQAYKSLLNSLLQPLLLFTYVVFRLIVPEYLFFRILKFSWNTFGIQYFFVVILIFALQCMQIYWFVKLLK